MPLALFLGSQNGELKYIADAASNDHECRSSGSAFSLTVRPGVRRYPQGSRYAFAVTCLLTDSVIHHHAT